MATVAVFSPAIAGTKPVICKYKGSIYFPAMYYFNRAWENPIFRKDRFRNNYYESLKKKDPDSWAIWPLVYQDPNRQVQAGEYPEQRAGGRAIRPGQWRQRVEGAIQVRGAVDEHEAGHERIRKAVNVLV